MNNGWYPVKLYVVLLCANFLPCIWFAIKVSLCFLFVCLFVQYIVYNYSDCIDVASNCKLYTPSIFSCYYSVLYTEN